MSVHLTYAQLRHNTWLYRRTYPRDVQPLLGAALKRSLRTGDVRLARERISELNATFEKIVAEARSKAGHNIESCEEGCLAVSLPRHERIKLRGGDRVADLVERYLAQRSRDLRPATFKAVQYGLTLFRDIFGDREVGALDRSVGRAYLKHVAALEPQGGTGRQLSSTTQARLWGNVRRFLAWAVAEGLLEKDPFDGLQGPRPKHASYAVMSDEEVTKLLAECTSDLRPILLTCLLSGLRSGEACGLMADEVVDKGNLGQFFRVVPNDLRDLKSEAAAREVPVHGVLAREVLPELPLAGPLFPNLSVDHVVKLFAKERQRLGLDRPGLVFHSTRKWFITQCERAGVPEHFTASLVGHQSARSGNRLTYGIYSAGITDDQKREIVDGIRLPIEAVA